MPEKAGQNLYKSSSVIVAWKTSVNLTYIRDAVCPVYHEINLRTVSLILAPPGIIFCVHTVKMHCRKRLKNVLHQKSLKSQTIPGILCGSIESECPVTLIPCT